jgi:hypothetical protein
LLFFVGCLAVAVGCWLLAFLLAVGFEHYCLAVVAVAVFSVPVGFCWLFFCIVFIVIV